MGDVIIALIAMILMLIGVCFIGSLVLAKNTTISILAGKDLTFRVLFLKTAIGS